MDKEIDEIKQKINDLAIKYGIRYIVFKTTDTSLKDGKIVGTDVEAEMIY